MNHPRDPASAKRLLARGYTWLTRALEVSLITLFAALVLDVLWGVFSRHVMGYQSGFTEEVAIYLLVWLSLLGAALVYAEQGHLGVDYFVSKLDPSAQRVAEFVVEILVLTFAAVALVYGGCDLVSETLKSGQVSPAIGVDIGYIYVAVPLSGVFFILFAAAHLVVLSRGQTTQPPPPES